MTPATARAHSNIALVKYWGKRDSGLNLPANGSLSLTLDGMHTTTTVAWRDDLERDRLTLNGTLQEGASGRALVTFLDRVRHLAGITARAELTSVNNFPTAAGLASSASGYAALALAATRSAGLELAPRELSLLARQGSGSASRSIFGGFARWNRGCREDGLDSFAEPIETAPWDLRMLVVVLAPGPKAVSSREGMTRTVATSPMYPAWLANAEADLARMEAAIRAQDLAAVGTLCEANCLRMHATMLTSEPAILYWQPATVAVLHRVRALREEGREAYFTMDAGPNVKVLAPTQDAPAIERALRDVPGVQDVLVCGPGPGAHLL